MGHFYLVFWGQRWVQSSGPVQWIDTPRRNQGGHRGHVPSQPAGKGGSAPTVRAMRIHAALGPTMKYHMNFTNK